MTLSNETLNKFQKLLFVVTLFFEEFIADCLSRVVQARLTFACDCNDRTPLWTEQQKKLYLKIA